jgi:hypothetical protein
MDRLTVEGTLAALSLMEAVVAAFVETAPRALARMGGVEGLIARSRMTAIGPIPRLSVEEWSAMVLESGHAPSTKLKMNGTERVRRTP